MKGWRLAGWLLVLSAAAALRIPRLDLRPMHNDEAVNAMKFAQLYVSDSYTYNPNEFHGPTLPYFTLPAAWLQGGGAFNRFGVATFRSVTVAFGIGLVLLPLLLRTDLGEAEAWWTGALTAISPAMIFYSRYYIHEMLLVFFTALTFMSVWRAGRSGGNGWTISAGVWLGLMAATKETFGFTIIALALAVGCAKFWSRWRDSGAGVGWTWTCGQAAVAAAVAALVAGLFYSCFGSHWSGVSDAVRTYLPWLRRAGGAETPHVHPWYFYFRRLFFYHQNGGPVWSEAFIGLLALVGLCQALAAKIGPGILLARIIAFYTIWLTIVYTVLPYKTPWCLLGFYDGMIFLAGIGATAIWRVATSKWKIIAGILLTAGALQLACQAARQNFAADRAGVPYCDTVKSPYVYSQTSPDLLRLVDTVNGLAQASPQGFNTVVEVISPQSYWPLPWYLRRFQHVGYWAAVPDQPLTPIMIVDASLRAGLDERDEHSHLMAGYFELRPGVFLELYVNTNLWSRYVKTLPREKD